MSEVHKEAISSLERLNNFDANDLVQKERLGENAFEAAVLPAKRVISLYRKIPAEVVKQLSEPSASKLKQSADATYSRLGQILEFDQDEGSVRSRRDGLLTALDKAYDTAFEAILPIISFAVAEATDFAQLEERGRAALQSVADSTAFEQSKIKDTLSEAENLLEEVRNVAAEEGVLKQASFFEKEAGIHVTSSQNWLVAAVVSAAILATYTILTLIFSQHSIFLSALLYSNIQIAVSKILLFSVLAYTVLSCVGNYRSHRHNAVVNKHRQNALMTYRTLSEAGASPEVRDTILNHAAAAIYAPVDSGYMKNEERGYGASLPAISLSPKPSVVSPSE